jgi:hypothetical protein
MTAPILFADHILGLFKNNLPNLDSNYLEIGVYFGISVADLANTFPNKKIYAIDPFIEDGNTSWHSQVGNTEKLNPQRAHALALIQSKSNIEFFETTSQEFYNSLTEEKIESMNVGAIFIDGNHHYEHVVNDYKLSLALIGKKQGLIVFDDDSLEPVRKAMNEFEEVAKDRIMLKMDLGRTSTAYNLKAI